MSPVSERSANFDLMRLAAAYLVLWSHHFPLNGLAEPASPYVGSVGGFEVYAFFAISGYLNAQSLFRSKSAAAFLTSRAFRIFPALAVCVVACVLLGAAVTRVGLAEYLWPPGSGLADRDTPFSFLWRNATLLFGIDYRLPGVFEGQPLPGAVNGSLWTLPHEARFYIYLAIAGLLFRYDARLVAAVLLTGLAVFALAGLAFPLASLWLGKSGLTFGIVFAAGVALALLEQMAGRSRALLAFAVAVAILLAGGHVETTILIAMAPGCVLLDAIRMPGWTRPRFDLSYGVYLYAFPIQQLMWDVVEGFGPRLALAVVLTTGCAVVSAVAVERPMLALRRRFADHGRAGQPMPGQCGQRHMRHGTFVGF
jgi:peptidoglycan/LPS O-acetylase OafA/YrhL